VISDAPSALVFQIVDVIRGAKLLGVEPDADYSLPVLLQKLEVWKTDGDNLYVFAVGDPDEIDVMRLADFDDMRLRMLTWTPVVASDHAVLKYTMLTNPRLAQPDLALTDPRCPLLTIIAALRSRGWHPGNRPYPHLLPRDGPVVPTVGDNTYHLVLVKNPADSFTRSYYLCLLGLQSLRDRGCSTTLPMCFSFPSDDQRGSTPKIGS